MGRKSEIQEFLTSRHPVATAQLCAILFLGPRGRQFSPDWDQAADDIAAVLRAKVGRDPYDRQLSDLIGELSTRSDEFRVRWAKHNVVQHRSGRKRVYHPIVGKEFIAEFEYAAEIVALGEGVDDWTVGDAVMGSTLSSFADYVLADHRFVLPDRTGSPRHRLCTVDRAAHRTRRPGHRRIPSRAERAHRRRLYQDRPHRRPDGHGT